MPKGWKAWTAWLGAQAVLTLALRLIYKLVEHAVLGWGDDQIATWMGLSSPAASTIVAWGIPIALAAGTLWIYHRVQQRFFRPIVVSGGDRFEAIGTVSGGRTSKKALVQPHNLVWFGFVGAALCIAVALYGLFLQHSRATPQYTPGDLAVMLRSLEQLNDVVEKKLVPNGEAAMVEWRKWENRPQWMTDVASVPQGLRLVSERFQMIWTGMQGGRTEISNIMSHLEIRLRNEISPVLAGYNEMYDPMAKAVGDLAVDLNTPGNPWSLVVPLRPGYDKLGIAAKDYQKWTANALKLIKEKTDQLKGWKS